MKFGKTVYACRIDRLCLCAWSIACIASKHIIGGYMNEGAIVDLYSLGEVAYSLCIQSLSEFNVILGLIDIGVGGTVYYDRNITGGHHPYNGFRICDIKFGHIGEYIVVT